MIGITPSLLDILLEDGDELEEAAVEDTDEEEDDDDDDDGLVTGVTGVDVDELAVVCVDWLVVLDEDVVVVELLVEDELVGAGVLGGWLLLHVMFVFSSKMYAHRSVSRSLFSSIIVNSSCF